MSDLVPVRRALISVSDKTGLADFARALVGEFKVELISTGGTAKFLRDQGLAVTDVADVTGFPEMMDGRVKTLHPKIHGGLRALRDNAEHVAAMVAHDIKPIDLVCINLYPFEQTIAQPHVTFEHAIENIDIGGPSMVRSAAKNHRFVVVVTSPDRYEKVLGDLRKHNGSSCGEHRLKQAQRAFAHTAAYDGKIAQFLEKVVGGAGPRVEAAHPSLVPDQVVALPETISISLARKQSLRYGENPHQKAALYADTRKPAEASVAFAEQLHGKELSYINLLDADAALNAVKELGCACIVKHATPCGFGAGKTLAQSFQRAYAGDPLAAFGGVLALGGPVDLELARLLTGAGDGKWFAEVIVAASYDADALDLLKTRWKNVRILAVGPIADADHIDRNDLSMHKIVGGLLVQERDYIGVDQSTWKVVTKRQPTPDEIIDMKIAWLACKHVKSNAIVIAKDWGTIGIGGGQVDRVNAARIAVTKAGDRAKGAVAASDAFFPFPDGPQILFDAGVTAIIHPGGSVRDGETVALANERGAAVVVTGQRHFRH
jgi:phosphoribosylaminoimidazolecarboxamide formyltransferase/IMP cyclohydrolase